jgi:hypothetical protein
MRRVRKEEVQIDAWVKPDGLNVCLECWKDWMLSDDRDLSASRMQLRGGAEDDDDQARAGYDSDPYAEQRKADYKIGEATGAMIEGMKPAWRWAIYMKCSVATQWKFPQLDYLTVLAEAETCLTEKLKKNIATAIQF